MTASAGQKAGTPDAVGRSSRGREKVRQIVAAATAVFLEDGYAGASMDKIVDRASVSKRTLYNYFPSKEAIFCEIIRVQVQEMRRGLERAHKKPGRLKRQLGQVGRELLSVVNAPAALSLFRLMASESQRFPELAREYFSQSMESIIDGIEQILTHATDKERYRIADDKEAAEYYADLLTGAAYYRVIFGITRPMTPDGVDKRVERALKHFAATYGRTE
ncbi:MAG: TetR/AcrR family transcriptional regulator [Pseudomonadota bacterium]